MVGQVANGHDNVLVAVNGNANTLTITLGHASLTLDLAHKRRGAVVKSSRDLLLTEVRATTFVGRKGELERFAQWLTSPAPIAVECVIGRGGAGKTRFGIELCERAEADGWIAGFVTGSELSRFHREQNISGWLWSGPTLLVVDYAAAKTSILRVWLDELARRPEPNLTDHPLRILLLERHADREVGWWSDLRRQEGLSGRRGDSFLEGVEPFDLPSLNDPEDRRRLMAQVMEHAASLAPTSPVPLQPDLGVDPEFDQELSADRIENEPLYLMMAAIVALEVGAGPALSRSRTELAQAIACHEEARLKKIATENGIDPILFVHLAACITLQGGCDPHEVEQLINQEISANPTWSGSSPEVTAEWLTDALSMPNGGVDAVRPDLIGGAFLLVVLRRKRRALQKQLDILGRAYKRREVAVIQTVVRTIVDHVSHNSNRDVLSWINYLVNLTKSLKSLANIADEIPEYTVVLRECAEVISRKLIFIISESVEEGPEKEAALIKNMNNLASYLAKLGKFDEALEIGENIIKKIQDNSHYFGDLYNQELATCLSNFANYLNYLGRHEEAFDASSKSIKIRRDFLKIRPEHFAPDLATSLSNHVSILASLGRWSEALDVATESVALHNNLFRQRPDAFAPDFAMSLSNQANIFNALGMPDKAFDAVTKAVTLRRFLVARRPDAFLPDLAMSLNNQAGFLSALGRPREALEVANQAINIRIQLAQQWPGAFDPDLAMSLNNKAKFLGALGEYSEALDTIDRSLSIYYKLSEVKGSVFYPNIAMGLNNKAGFLSVLGHQEKAVKAAKESVSMCRNLIDSRSIAFKHDLAMSLSNLSVILCNMDNISEAVNAITESSDIYFQLSADNPGAFDIELSGTLYVFSNCLSLLGDNIKACDIILRSIKILKDKFFENPLASFNLMATLCKNYIMLCDLIDRDLDFELIGPIAEIIERIQLNSKENEE